MFQLPVNLLRAGRVVVFEPPPGVKANLQRTFSTVPASRMCKVCVALYIVLQSVTDLHVSSLHEIKSTSIWYN